MNPSPKRHRAARTAAEPPRRPGSAGSSEPRAAGPIGPPDPADPGPALGRRGMLLGGAVSLGLGPVIAACEAVAPRAEAPRPRPRAVEEPTANLEPRPLPSRPAVDGEGAQVHRVFPKRPGQHQDPFVLLDEFHVGPPAGFPMHPHRGFEAFTYMIDGAFRHRDDLGNDSVVHAGGTQRFTSGRGAWHSEMPGEPRESIGLQLWVNLPPERKRRPPEYEPVHGDALPLARRGRAEVRTVVGPGSPVRLETPVRFLDILLDTGAELVEAVPDGWTGLAYLLDGALEVGRLALAPHTGAVLDAGPVRFRAVRRARFALLTGLPHGAPIRQHGPYVD